MLKIGPQATVQYGLISAVQHPLQERPSNENTTVSLSRYHVNPRQRTHLRPWSLLASQCPYCWHMHLAVDRRVTAAPEIGPEANHSCIRACRAVRHLSIPSFCSRCCLRSISTMAQWEE
ncbi:hypothetical protein J3F84DRAFT_357150 [Trichoderma pleuroticola]